jgi:hypothetical protein
MTCDHYVAKTKTNFGEPIELQITKLCMNEAKRFYTNGFNHRKMRCESHKIYNNGECECGCNKLIRIVETFQEITEEEFKTLEILES